MAAPTSGTRDWCSASLSLNDVYAIGAYVYIPCMRRMSHDDHHDPLLEKEIRSYAVVSLSPKVCKSVRQFAKINTFIHYTFNNTVALTHGYKHCTQTDMNVFLTTV